MNILNSEAGKQLINGTSGQLGIDNKSAASAFSSALPLLLGAMQNNASSQEGAQGLLNALNNPRHSGGSMLNNLSSILGGDSIDSDVLNDGAKILGHLFGGQEHTAAGAISKSSGLNMDSVMHLLQLAAPFVLSYLGQKSASNNISDKGGLEDMLGSLLGGNSDIASMASVIQGFDNNDSSIEDIAGALTGGKGTPGGLGGLLNNLFK